MLKHCCTKFKFILKDLEIYHNREKENGNILLTLDFLQEENKREMKEKKKKRMKVAEEKGSRKQGYEREKGVETIDTLDLQR